MPKTAIQLVTRTRQLLQLLEGTNKAYRDGFAEVDTEPTPILPAVNEFLTVCSMTGVKSGDVNIGAVINQREYTFSSGVVKIYGVYRDGIALRPTTRQALDQIEPAWINSTGPATRYFREGQNIVLDKRPQAAAQLVIRAAFLLTLFTGGSATTQELDSAIPDSAAERIPYGAAYIQGTIDAENPAHVKRLNQYKSIADGLLMELTSTNDRQDYASPVSLDDWRGPIRVPLPDAEEMLGYQVPQGTS